jgi:hypothetical protein
LHFARNVTIEKTRSTTRALNTCFFVVALRRTLSVVIGLVLGGASMALAQIDPYPRGLLQLGYDQSLSGQGPQSLYAYYYYNNPEFLRANMALRLVRAPVAVGRQHVRLRR